MSKRVTNSEEHTTDKKRSKSGSHKETTGSKNESISLEDQIIIPEAKELETLFQDNIKMKVFIAVPLTRNKNKKVLWSIDQQNLTENARRIFTGNDHYNVDYIMIPRCDGEHLLAHDDNEDSTDLCVSIVREFTQNLSNKEKLDIFQAWCEKAVESELEDYQEEVPDDSSCQFFYEPKFRCFTIRVAIH